SAFRQRLSRMNVLMKFSRRNILHTQFHSRSLHLTNFSTAIPPFMIFSSELANGTDAAQRNRWKADAPSRHFLLGITPRLCTTSSLAVSTSPIDAIRPPQHAQIKIIHVRLSGIVSLKKD
ncbi:hypothetical protein RvY_19078, partial [Ramazzottius varieornatus]